MCISVESHDGSASSWLSHEGSCPHVLCKADAHLKRCPLFLLFTALCLSLSFTAASRNRDEGNSLRFGHGGRAGSLMCLPSGCFWLERDILTFSSVHPPKEHSAPLLHSVGDCF